MGDQGVKLLHISFEPLHQTKPHQVDPNQAVLPPSSIAWLRQGWNRSGKTGPVRQNRPGPAGADRSEGLNRPVFAGLKVFYLIKFPLVPLRL